MILHRSLHPDDILHPSEQDMVSAIGELLDKHTDDGPGYVVLADGQSGAQRVSGPGVIQVVGTAESWIVEFRDRESGKWYRIPQGLPKAKVVALFHAFYKGDRAQLSGMSWTESAGHPEVETPAVQIFLWLILTAAVMSIAFLKL